MLSNTELKRIDSAAKDFLENPGIQLDDAEIIETMMRHGAKPGARTSVVRVPREMVDEYLAIAPSRVKIASRETDAMDIGPGSPSCFWTGASMFYLDQGGYRPISTRELTEFARIIDALSGVDAIVGTAIDDVPPRHRDFAGLRLMAANTKKHIRALCFTPTGGEALLEMGAVLAGSDALPERPVFSVGFTAHGPLRWTSLALGIFKATAGHGIPATVNGEPMAGASAPVTLAGTAAVGTAEILAGIVVNQLLEPGRPCLFNLGFAHIFDMRHSSAVTGGPENSILAATGAELARFYNLPSVSWMCTDSLGYDEQNSAEKAFAALAHASAGVNVVWGVGQVESEKTVSPVQAVIDDEIIGITRRYTRGLTVDKDSLAVEEVRRVGIGGNFLATDHTLKNFREEFFEPALMNRSMRSASPAGSDINLRERAVDRVRDILDREIEPILTAEQERELQRIEAHYARLL